MVEGYSILYGAAQALQVIAADLPGPLTNTVTITATPTANEPMTVTTAVATPLEPYVIYLPFVINSVAATFDTMENTAVTHPAQFITGCVIWTRRC
jgi:hypothetical protein